MRAALDGALLLGDAAATAPLADLYATIPPSTLTRLMRVPGGRVRTQRAAAAGNEQAGVDAFSEALAAARSLGRTWALAPVLADYGTWLVACGRSDDAALLLDEASALFDQMGARRWLDRIATVRPTATAASSS